MCHRAGSVQRTSALQRARTTGRHAVASPHPQQRAEALRGQVAVLEAQRSWLR
jgi:hypothetical protein